MDPVLAFVHHLAAFGLVAAQAVQTTMLRGPLDAPRLRRLVAVDRLQAAALATVAVAGTLRVIAGPKGAAFYLPNPLFWLKVAAVAAMAVLALGPARRYRAWQQAAQADPAFAPSAGAMAATRRPVFIAAHLLVVVLAAAVAMARGLGL